MSTMIYAVVREIKSENDTRNTFECVRVFQRATPSQAETELRLLLNEIKNKPGDKWHLFTCLQTIDVVKK